MTDALSSHESCNRPVSQRNAMWNGLEVHTELLEDSFLTRGMYKKPVPFLSIHHYLRRIHALPVDKRHVLVVPDSGSLSKDTEQV